MSKPVAISLTLSPLMNTGSNIPFVSNAHSSLSGDSKQCHSATTTVPYRFHTVFCENRSAVADCERERHHLHKRRWYHGGEIGLATNLTEALMQPSDDSDWVSFRAEFIADAVRLFALPIGHVLGSDEIQSALRSQCVRARYSTGKIAGNIHCPVC